MVENSAKVHPESTGSLAIQAGFSPATAHNVGAIIARPSFQQLLDMVDDDAVLARVYEIALDDDKRSALAAADMLLKLKDRYPANKLKMSGFNDELSEIVAAEPEMVAAPFTSQSPAADNGSATFEPPPAAPVSEGIDTLSSADAVRDNQGE